MRSGYFRVGTPDLDFGPRGETKNFQTSFTARGWRSGGVRLGNDVLLLANDWQPLSNPLPADLANVWNGSKISMANAASPTTVRSSPRGTAALLLCLRTKKLF